MAVRIEVARRLPVGREPGYAYITDPANWPDYWPGLVRILSAERWREPGDRAALLMRLLGRDVELRMTLRRIEPGRLVAYTSEQDGLPTVRHERHFEDRDGALFYRLAVEYEPRPGLRAPFDRYAVRRAIRRSLLATVANLERRFAAGA